MAVNSLKFAIVGTISLLVTMFSVKGQVYTIDASATSKKVVSSDYVMGTPTNPDGEAITLNNYYLMKSGKPWFPVMGEIHYSRYMDNLWDDAIKKMKAGGLNIVATYCFWNHHEEIEGEFDFTGRRDLKRFVQTCKENQMYVLLRIGPFCNGEMRNGGIPDWVKNKGMKARTNDPEYLKLVHALYQEYYNQVKGMLYKDGGPVIGIQLDNELNNPEHILELKRIAREVGFDVPLYTVTGWNNVVIPEKEVIPVQAGYPDDFWSGGVGKNSPNTQFLFKAGIPINTGVGTDVLPVLETYGKRTYNPSDYPWFMAELGCGMQWTNRRRPVIDERDAGALMLVKLAGGANLIGYYMYLGGSNPDGKLTPLGAGRGMSTISYDYQGAISEFGELPLKYHVLKLAHYFIQDFGSSLAPMIPSMPSRCPTDVEDINTFRCMVRANNNSGYLFFNNYQRYVENKDLNNIQVQIKLKDSEVTIPSKPITIPKDAFGIWPINLNMNGAILEYATAQVFAHFTGDDEDAYFFFAHDGITPELVFQNNSISNIDAGAVNRVSTNSQNTSISVKEPGLTNTIVVKSKTGKNIRICVLSRELALRTTRIDFKGKPHLVVTDGANVLSDAGRFDILSFGSARGTLWIYPATGNLKMNDKVLKSSVDGIFSKYEWAVKGKNISVNLKKIPDGDNSKYELSIPSNALDGVYDVHLDIAHTCDYLTAKLGDHLIGDWYYIGAHYRPSLLHWGRQVVGKTISFELTPLTDKTQCFIEKEYLPDFSVKKSYAEIDSVRAIPVYRISFN
ncbi:MAG: beta-galactosidase [Bacteroidales bacterium]|nr:beta-galactosidase [Bacteroidales bacterium]